MAATDVYAAIRRVPFGYAEVNEKITFDDIDTTTDGFYLAGGYYGVDAKGSTFGSVSLQKLLQDGSTWLAVGSSTTFSANGSVVVLLGPGRYRLAIS